MFWTITTPCLLTIGVAVATVLLATWYAPRLHGSRAVAFFRSCAVWIVAFIPCCIAINLAVDALRFGVFHYETGAGIGDWRVERYFPRGARDVKIAKYPSGFMAEFRMPAAELEAWIDEQWRLHGALSAVERRAPEALQQEELHRFLQQSFPPGFALTPEWSKVTDLQTVSGPIGGNGSGVRFHYSASTGLCFADAGYW